MMVSAGTRSTLERTVLKLYEINPGEQKEQNLQSLVKTNGYRDVAQTVAKKVGFFAHIKILIEVGTCSGIFNALWLMIRFSDFRRNPELYMGFLANSALIKRLSFNAQTPVREKSDVQDPPLTSATEAVQPQVDLDVLSEQNSEDAGSQTSADPASIIQSEQNSEDAPMQINADEQSIISSEQDVADSNLAQSSLPTDVDYSYLCESTPTYETSDQSIQNSNRLEDFYYTFKGTRSENLPRDVEERRADVIEDRKHILGMRVPRVAREDFGFEMFTKILLDDGCTGSVSAHTFAGGIKFVSKKFKTGPAAYSSAIYGRLHYYMCTAGVPDAISYAHDIASKNIIAFRVAQILAQLGNALDAIPIVRSWAVTDRENINKHVPVELFMECAPGDEIARCRPPGGLNICQKAEFARQLIWLHINDYITNQRDHHSGNVFVKFSQNGCVVKGIDNDLCLPEKNNKLSAFGIYTDHGPPEYPPYIDSEMHGAIMALTVDSLREVMQSSGRNPDVNPFKRELNAMWERVEGLKAMAERRKQEGRVLESRAAWCCETVLEDMNERNSYYGKFLPELNTQKEEI
ncbi:MAG: hypothetical protein LBF26_02590 [Puniceicoccales bacterium]|jgi:hypothetical protein|nr:hypothetical protein [Puniceicoccales bacterium]